MLIPFYRNHRFQTIRLETRRCDVTVMFEATGDGRLDAEPTPEVSTEEVGTQLDTL